MFYVYSINADSNEQHGCHASHVAHVCQVAITHRMHWMHLMYSHAFEHLYKEKERKHVAVNQTIN